MILEAKNLTKFYGLRKAVDGLHLEIPQGSVYGFLGPNGSGKSTTIRMMTALISPDEGEVVIKGKSVNQFGNEALNGVGALIERADFHKHLSGRTNLEMLARMDGTNFDRIDYVLERTGLSQRGDDKVKTYSQGMKQRLGIAQALLSNPELLILDEPTNGLDPSGMKEVRDLIGELSAEGITIFVSSHLLDEVQKICTHAAIIHLGRLITSGEMDTLLKDSELFVTEIRVSDAAKTTELLSSLDWVFHCESSNGSVKVNMDKARISYAVKLLVESGVEVSAVIPRASLEEVFLSKIGSGSPI